MPIYGFIIRVGGIEGNKKPHLGHRIKDNVGAAFSSDPKMYLMRQEAKRDQEAREKADKKEHGHVVKTLVERRELESRGEPTELSPPRTLPGETVDDARARIAREDGVKHAQKTYDRAVTDNVRKVAVQQRDALIEHTKGRPLARVEALQIVFPGATQLAREGLEIGKDFRYGTLPLEQALEHVGPALERALADGMTLAQIKDHLRELAYQRWQGGSHAAVEKDDLARVRADEAMKRQGIDPHGLQRAAPGKTPVLEQEIEARQPGRQEQTPAQQLDRGAPAPSRRKDAPAVVKAPEKAPTRQSSREDPSTERAPKTVEVPKGRSKEEPLPVRRVDAKAPGGAPARGPQALPGEEPTYSGRSGPDKGTARGKDAPTVGIDPAVLQQMEATTRDAADEYKRRVSRARGHEPGRGLGRGREPK